MVIEIKFSVDGKDFVRTLDSVQNLFDARNAAEKIDHPAMCAFVIAAEDWMNKNMKSV